MQLKGTVLKATTEEKELVSKEGIKRISKVSHVVMTATLNGNLEVLNVRCYDAVWPLPDVGKDWVSPRVRKYEAPDGNVAEVSVCPNF